MSDNKSLYFFIKNEVVDKLIEPSNFSDWQRLLHPSLFNQPCSISSITNSISNPTNIISHVENSSVSNKDLESYYLKNMKIRYLVKKFVNNLKIKVAKKRLIGKEDLRTFEEIKEEDAIDVICLK